MTRFFLIKPPEYSHGFRVVCLNGPPPPTDEVAAEPVAEVVAWRYGGMDWMSGKQDHSSVAPRSLILAEQYEVGGLSFLRRWEVTVNTVLMVQTENTP